MVSNSAIAGRWFCHTRWCLKVVWIAIAMFSMQVYTCGKTRLEFEMLCSCMRGFILAPSWGLMAGLEMFRRSTSSKHVFIIAPPCAHRNTCCLVVPGFWTRRRLRLSNLSNRLDKPLGIMSEASQKQSVQTRLQPRIQAGSCAPTVHNPRDALP